MSEVETKPTCFIIMPITTPAERLTDYGDEVDHFKHVMEALFIPAVAAAGYEPVKPHFSGSPVIQGQIIKNLINADLVLCDMSILNPNVFFELGVRSAMNGPVAAVRDHLTPKIPFDVGSVSAYEYDGSLAAWRLDDQREKLAAHLQATAGTGSHNELWRYFGITQTAATPPEGTPAEVMQATLNELLAEFRHDAALRADAELRHEVNVQRYPSNTMADQRARRLALETKREELMVQLGTKLSGVRGVREVRWPDGGDAVEVTLGDTLDLEQAHKVRADSAWV